MIDEVFTSCTSVVGGTSVDKVLRFTSGRAMSSNSASGEGVSVSENMWWAWGWAWWWARRICYWFRAAAEGGACVHCSGIVDMIGDRLLLQLRSVHIHDALPYRCVGDAQESLVNLQMQAAF